MARKTTKAKPAARTKQAKDEPNEAAVKAALSTLRSHLSAANGNAARLLLRELAALVERAERRANAPGAARQLTDVDLDEVRRLAGLGLRGAQIARVMRLERKVLFGEAHEDEVREAVADGEALWAKGTLEIADKMVKGDEPWNPVAIFALKQAPIGWTDRQTVQGPGADGAIPIEIEGAAERLLDAVLKVQAAELERRKGR